MPDDDNDLSTISSTLDALISRISQIRGDFVEQQPISEGGGRNDAADIEALDAVLACLQDFEGKFVSLIYHPWSCETHS